jgi:hypothetical protein
VPVTEGAEFESAAVRAKNDSQVRAIHDAGREFEAPPSFEIVIEFGASLGRAQRAQAMNHGAERPRKVFVVLECASQRGDVVPYVPRPRRYGILR